MYTRACQSIVGLYTSNATKDSMYNTNSREKQALPIDCPVVVSGEG